jgi:hypothetical protein
MKKISRNDALRGGLTRYYTGNLCVLGHISERLASSGKCVICNKEMIKNKRKKAKEEGMLVINKGI